MWAVEEWVVGGGPIFDSLADVDETRRSGHERDNDFSKRAAG